MADEPQSYEERKLDHDNRRLHFEHEKWKHEINREDAKRAHDRVDAARDRADTKAIESSNEALKALMLINSGSIVVILAFAGAAISKEAIRLELIRNFVPSLTSFAYGVTCSAVGYLLAYLVHYYTTEGLHAKKLTWEHPFEDNDLPEVNVAFVRRNAAHLAAVIASVLSLGLFVHGALSAADAVAIATKGTIYEP